MSTSRGNSSRTRSQKHQNKTAFKNDLHDKTNTTKFLNSMKIEGLCNRCKGIIEWKIKYKKYKTLSAPTKCVSCSQKTVKFAYHVICTPCAESKNVCAKCLTKNEDISAIENTENSLEVGSDIELLLKKLPERKRRTMLRLLEKQKTGGNTSVEKLNKNIMEMLKNCDDNDSDFSSCNEDEDEHEDY